MTSTIPKRMSLHAREDTVLAFILRLWMYVTAKKRHIL